MCFDCECSHRHWKNVARLEAADWFEWFDLQQTRCYSSSTFPFICLEAKQRPHNTAATDANFKNNLPFFPSKITCGIWVELINSGARGKCVRKREGICGRSVFLIPPRPSEEDKSPGSEQQSRRRTDGMTTHKHTNTGARTQSDTSAYGTLKQTSRWHAETETKQSPYKDQRRRWRELHPNTNIGAGLRGTIRLTQSRDPCIHRRPDGETRGKFIVCAAGPHGNSLNKEINRGRDGG